MTRTWFSQRLVFQCLFQSGNFGVSENFKLHAEAICQYSGEESSLCILRSSTK